MRTPLRARAYVEADDGRAAEPQAYADACVTLLAEGGRAHRGSIWRPTP
jgi:hypothetical protein